MTNEYRVGSNTCKCHPETCCCPSYAIYDSSNEKVPGYAFSDKVIAENVARLLNMEDKKQDHVPQNCRQRLMQQGKAYPKSGCAACGEFSPMGKYCDINLKPSKGNEK